MGMVRANGPAVQRERKEKIGVKPLDAHETRPLSRRSFCEDALYAKIGQ